MLQVGAAECKLAAGANGQQGYQWSIPLSLCKNKRVGQDNKGQQCFVTDCTMHPASVERCRADPRFMGIAVEAALEQAGKAMCTKLSSAYTLPKKKFKGTADCPDTPCVTVRSPMLRLLYFCNVGTVLRCCCTAGLTRATLLQSQHLHCLSTAALGDVATAAQSPCMPLSCHPLFGSFA
jgi:PIH1 N-terminal domain